MFQETIMDENNYRIMGVWYLLRKPQIENVTQSQQSISYIYLIMSKMSNSHRTVPQSMDLYQVPYLSLENFNPASTKEPILTRYNPRSLEACRRQGILPNELVQLSVVGVKQMFRDLRLDQRAWELKWQHYEERRQEKLRVVIEERQNIIQSDSMQNSNGSGQRKQGGVPSTLLENERKQMEVIRARQQKEIEQMLEHEMKLQEIRQRNEEKQRILHEREMQREEEVKRKRAEQEQLKLLKEQERERKMQEEEENQRQIAYAAFLKEQERAKLEEQKMKQQKTERRMKEEEKKLQQLQYQQQTQEILRKQQEEIDRKRKIMEEKAEQRTQLLRDQQEQRIQASKAAQLELAERIQQAKYKNEQELLRMRENFETKQQTTEQKRLQFEYDKQQRQEQARIQQEQHAQQIQKVLETNFLLEEQKKREYYERQNSAQRRKMQQDQEKMQELEQRRRQEQMKEEQRKQVQRNNEMRLKSRTDQFLTKMQMKEQLQNQMLEEKSEEFRQRRTNELLRYQDKRENVERIMRMQEYQRDKLKEKLDEKIRRVDTIQQEKQMLYQQRFMLKKQVDLQKQELIQKFELVKQGKLSPQSLSADGRKPLEKTTGQGQSLSMISQPKTPQGRPNSSQQFIKKTAMKQRPMTSLGSASQQKTIQKPPFFGQNPEMEDVRIEQNREMIELLEAEQVAEQRREEQLMQCDDQEEQFKLEGKFSLERARAQARIQRLQDQHERRLDAIYQN